MARDILICGLDIGSTLIRTVIAQKRKGSEALVIVGVGEVPSAGVRKGVVIDLEDAVPAVAASIAAAEQSSGYRVSSCFVSLSGPHISSRYSKGVVSVSRADQEISRDDIVRALAQAQSIAVPPNKEIIHVLPKEYAVDGESGIHDPLGMRGLRLEVNALVVEGSTPLLRNLATCIESANKDIDGLAVAALASARAVLTKRQMELGVIALDIGGWTSGITAFEEGNVIHTAVLPVGAAHVTNDIAIGLQLDIDLAEAVKVRSGVCRADAVNKREMITLGSEEDNEKLGVISRKEVAEIIEARLDEIFDLVDRELKKISKQMLFPGGVVLTGGGARMNGIAEFAKQRLKLPVHIGVPLRLDGIVDQTATPEYATAVGLCLLSLDGMEKKGTTGIFPWGEQISHVSGGFLRRWARMFLP